jgi:peptide/nickel transport system substrate-binding protein
LAHIKAYQKLKIGVHYEPSGLDPHIGAAELALQMTNGIFDTLVNKTVEGEYLPGLAESYEVSEDQCTYRLKLREGVSFHDGTPFNAAAVKFSLDRAHNPANKSQLARGMLGPYRQSVIVDNYTLAIHLTQPYALLLDTLSQGWLAPVSPAAVQRLGQNFARAPVGTGPFIFSKWVPGEYLSIVRNSNYGWAPPLVKNKGPAFLDEIEYHFIADNEARTDALRRGDVDMIFYVAPKDVSLFRSDTDYFATTKHIRGVPVCMMMNIEKGPTNDLLVRRAINFAIDQDTLVKEVFFGEFERAYGPVSQFTLGYEKDVEAYYPYSITKAEALLSEAGWELKEDGLRYKGDTPLTLDFYALPVNFYREFGVIITRQLAVIGICVHVHLEQPIEWIKSGMRGDHHLIPQGKYASSSQLLSFVYHSRNSAPNSYGWSKRSANHCPNLDDLLEKAEQTLTIKDFVPLYDEVQIIVMEEALIAPLHCNTNIIAGRNCIQNVIFDAIGAYPLFHDTTMSDSLAKCQ